jgi:hypothetical protein
VRPSKFGIVIAKLLILWCFYDLVPSRGRVALHLTSIQNYCQSKHICFFSFRRELVIANFGSSINSLTEYCSFNSSTNGLCTGKVSYLNIELLVKHEVFTLNIKMRISSSFHEQKACNNLAEPESYPLFILTFYLINHIFEKVPIRSKLQC